MIRPPMRRKRAQIAGLSGAYGAGRGPAGANGLRQGRPRIPQSELPAHGTNIGIKFGPRGDYSKDAAAGKTTARKDRIAGRH